MSNNNEEFAVRIKVPFDTPFSDPDWFDTIPIPTHWANNPHLFSLNKNQPNRIEYLIHPLKDYHYSEKTPIIKWAEWDKEYIGQVDITDNEVSSEFVHPRFLRWLDGLGLEISNWDLFITPPNMILGAHKDTDTETVKLNFVKLFGEGISQQNYLTEDGEEETLEKPTGDPDVKNVMFGGKVIHYHNVASDWTTPSLTNVGRWHEVVNGTLRPRVCISYQLKRKKDRHVSLWSEVYPILKEFVIE